MNSFPVVVNLPFNFVEFKNHPVNALAKLEFATPPSPGKTNALVILLAFLYTAEYSHKQRMRGKYIHEIKGRKRLKLKFP